MGFFYTLCLLWSSRLLVSISPNLDVYTLRLVSNTSAIQPLLTTMGGILATILAISFSIAILVIQHAAASYTASILESYKRDYLTIVFFGYYVGSLVLTIIALQLQSDLYLVNMALITFLFSFFFLFMHFIHIIDLIDPRRIIEKAENQCIKYINSIPHKIQSIIKNKKPRNKFDEILLETPLYQQFVFQSETTLQEPIRKQVLLINDVINKAVSRREIETSIRGFEGLSRIAENYINIREKDFGSEDKFLQYIYAQLLSVFTIGLDNKDAALMQEVLHVFERIGCSTTSLKVADGSTPHVTNLAMTHIRDLSIMSFERDFVDVSTLGIDSLKTVSISSIQRNGDEGLASDYIFEIGRMGVQKNSWYVLAVALNQLKELFYGAVFFKLDVHGAPTRLLKHITKLAVLGIQKKLDRYALQTSLFTILPEYSIRKAAWAALKLKNEEYPQIETHSREEYSKDIMSKLVRTIGGIAIVSSEAHSTHTLRSAVDCLLDITLLMIKEEFKTIQEGFKTEILRVIKTMERSYLAIAGYSFDEEWFLSAPSEIGDAITSIAAFAIESQKEVTEECLQALDKMCLNMIKRDKGGYDVARLASRIGVVGAIALSKNESLVAEKAATLLANFEKIYLQDSPSPQRREYIDEMMSLHKKFKKENYIMVGNTQTYSDLYNKIETTDIDDFVKLFDQKKRNDKKSNG